MFNFLHPRPVVNGRAVAVQVVQQKKSSQMDTQTLIVTAKSPSSTKSLQGHGISKP
jgi:hypothetical protein